MPDPTFLTMLGQQAGGQAAGNLINEGMGIAFAGIKNKQQQRQAKALTNIQLDAQKHMGDFNFKKQMELWEKTGYGAQVAQMKSAGINPALLYGMGGAGGQSTAANTGSVQGQTAQIAAASHGAEGMGMQLPLIKAQVANINADTRKKNIEADKAAGVDTELTKAQTASITQGIENQKVQKALIEIQDSILRNELFEKYSTQDWRFKYIEAEQSEKLAQARSAMAQANVDEKTQDDKIRLLASQAVGQTLINILTQAQTGKTLADTSKIRAEIVKIVNDMALGWAQLTLEQKKAQLQGIATRLQTEQGYQFNGYNRLYDNEQKIIDYIDGLFNFKVNKKTTN